jgi:hypothetical protein
MPVDQSRHDQEVRRGQIDIAPDSVLVESAVVCPSRSMIRWCVCHAVPWQLHYCVRSQKCAAYLEDSQTFGDRVLLYANDELESLERHGVSSPFSCREGLCRSCEVGVLSGEVEHRDYLLSEDEQRSGNAAGLMQAD